MVGRFKAGKSAVLNTLFHPDSLLVIDPKGELAGVTGAKRRMAGDEVALDLHAAWHSDVDKAGFNPLMHLDPAVPKFYDSAEGLAAALIPGGGIVRSHFSVRLRCIIAVAMMWECKLLGASAPYSASIDGIPLVRGK